jgi:hypothetical protein
VLRQLAALTRRVPAAGPRALAVAVYSGSNGELFGARESGVEGVACVDDAARACVLLCRLWAVTGNVALRSWAEGLLDFVLWMHEADGHWHNFIYDWNGDRNSEGLTSVAGINFWQARAIFALAEATLLLDNGAARSLLAEGLVAASAGSPPPDVRALHALTVLAVLHRAPDPRLSSRLAAWCEELTECRVDGMLMNSPDERGRPHLWGHVQEAALIDAAVALDRKDLGQVAVSSANAVFTEVIESGFDLPHVHAYDVQSAVFVMDRLAAGTGQQRYRELAQKARRWFDGRNSAKLVVYDRAIGRVADGLDDGRLNDRSGAEANISAGLALSDDPLVLSTAGGWTGRSG